VYVPPGAVAVKTVEEPGQRVAFATVGAIGTGLTVIEKLKGVPTHEFADGVTVITPVTGNAPAFADVKDGIFPKPDAAVPILGLEFVQLKLVPVTFPVNVEIGTIAPLQ
jgi:hypothetical protein